MENINVNEAPELQAIDGRIAEVHKTVTELLGERATLEQQWRAGKNNSVADKAERVADGGMVDPTMTLPAEVAQIDQAIEIHQEAIRLLQRRRRDAQCSISYRLCQEALTPEYNKSVVSKMRTATRTLLDAMAFEQEFLDMCERNGIEIGFLNRLHLPQVLNRESLRAFLAEAEQRMKYGREPWALANASGS